MAISTFITAIFSVYKFYFNLECRIQKKFFPGQGNEMILIDSFPIDILRLYEVPRLTLIKKVQVYKFPEYQSSQVSHKLILSYL